ncbi:hypothetical protein J6590_083174 [Homalodisca vitripennis]|nr:hypothetical protein J6590_083174 [Homalodisca vitripennis]
MDLLPLEALNIIADNRTLYVLAASSTVNVGWRGRFKQNWMWWPQCNVDTAEYLETAEFRVDLTGSFNQNWMWWQHWIAVTTEYVESSECRVEPRFESPE